MKIMKMKKISAVIFGFAILCGGLVAVTHAQSPRMRVAVRRFDNPSAYPDSTIGDAVTDMFFRELGRTGQFDLVDRSIFDDATRQVDFGAPDWAQKGAFPGRAGAIGADFIVMGQVRSFSFDEQVFQRARRDWFRQSATVRVDFRIVSTRTGVAVVTESGADTQTLESETSGLATFRRIQRMAVFNGEAQDHLIGRATIGAVRNAVRKANDLSPALEGYLANHDVPSLMGTSPGASGSAVDPLASATGHIIGMANGAYFVDLGQAVGLQPGDRLTVSREDLTKDSQGAVLYRQEKVIGSLDVVDVSMVDRAKAELPRVAAGNPDGPREGDIVRVDLATAAALRGGSAPGSPATSMIPGAPAAPPNPADVQRLTRQGDRYMEDKYYPQAIDSYQQALAMQPRSADIMDKLVGAFLADKQLDQAEQTIDQIFAIHGEFSINVLHNHAIGFCEGPLRIGTGGISYEPTSGDHAFRVDASKLVEFGQGKELQNGIPLLTVRIIDAKGDNKNDDYVVPQYLRQIRPTGGVLGNSMTEAFAAGPTSLVDTAKVHRMLIRLVQDNIKR